MINSGVDVFIVHNSHLKKKSNYIDINRKEPKELNNDFRRKNRQGLLPKKFICEWQYNNTCDLNERQCLPIQNHCHYLCLYYKQFILEPDRNDFSCNLLISLVNFVDKRLTKKQKLVLKKIKTTQKKITMTSLSNILSEELNFSKTTVRNILQILRDVDLIYCGNVKNKGEPVRLTKIGEIVNNRLKEKEN